MIETPSSSEEGDYYNKIKPGETYFESSNPQINQEQKEQGLVLESSNKKVSYQLIGEYLIPIKT